ncbi:MAG TPA: hypothetical protein VIE65_12825 [Methylobacter sp.]|jgi:hypothetical protein
MDNLNYELELRLVEFPPGSFIELDDPLTGVRHMVLVCESGKEFLDFIDEDTPATPLPIFDALDPKQCADRHILAFNVLMNSPEKHEAYSAFLEALYATPAVDDELTHNRAAKWAYDTGNYDAQEAARAGIELTRQARVRQFGISQKATQWLETEATL